MDPSQAPFQGRVPIGPALPGLTTPPGDQKAFRASGTSGPSLAVSLQPDSFPFSLLIDLSSCRNLLSHRGPFPFVRREESEGRAQKHRSCSAQAKTGTPELSQGRPGVEGERGEMKEQGGGAGGGYIGVRGGAAGAACCRPGCREHLAML